MKTKTVRMAEERKKTFDQYLQNKRLKTAVNVQEFCNNRTEEILMLTEALQESPFRGQAFQRLPKHMRRRQMSHHIKRLPRRLRNNTILSVQMDASGIPKRPSRKYRRRPSNLLLEYNRRQRKSAWLETHIWHARRFHMTSKWGYSLPEKPTNKSFRACYRAVKNHCSIIDLSYYSIVELQGRENVILDGLQKCVSTNCGLTFAAKMFKSGSREGFVTMYHPNSFPHAVIGEVSFLWKPIEIENESRTIWIFVHPILYNEVTDVFKTSFFLSEVENPQEITVAEVKPTNSSDDLKKKGLVKKSNTRINYFEETSEFINKDGSIVMKLLKNKLNRFRLTGPLSMAVISNAFDVINLQALEQASCFKAKQKKLYKQKMENPQKREHSDMYDNECIESAKKVKVDEDCIDQKCDNVSVQWWSKFYRNDFRKHCLESQSNLYKQLTSFHKPSDLPPGMVLSILVKDPRLTLPPKRTKCLADKQENARLTSLDSSLCYSPLWESDLMEEVSNNKIPTSLVNKARAKLIVPGSDINFVLKDDEKGKIPLIIIQHTRVSARTPLDIQDFSSGLDVIVPLGWAMPVWLSLVFRGARPAGLREFRSIALESKNLNECIQPDSKAGEYENVERYQKLKSNYFRRPPSKRPNFAKIGVQSPFYFPWKVLVNDWAQTKNSQCESELKFYVLRDLEKLSRLNDFLGNAMSKKSKLKDKIKGIDSFALEDMNCLVPIFVQSCEKGVPMENAMLCLPTTEDVKEFKNKKICPTEPTHADPNVRSRKFLKFEHAKLLKSMKRKRRLIRMKKAEEQYSEKDSSTLDTNKRRISTTKENIDKYNKVMEALWLKEPHNIDTIKDTCSRAILGFVVLGGFSFLHANGTGLGYITLHGLLQLLEMSIKHDLPPLILFRNNNSIQYRFVKIHICMNKSY